MCGQHNPTRQGGLSYHLPEEESAIFRLTANGSPTSFNNKDTEMIQSMQARPPVPCPVSTRTVM